MSIKPLESVITANIKICFGAVAEPKRVVVIHRYETASVNSTTQYYYLCYNNSNYHKSILNTDVYSNKIDYITFL